MEIYFQVDLGGWGTWKLWNKICILRGLSSYEEISLVRPDWRASARQKGLSHMKPLFVLMMAILALAWS